MKGGVYTGNLSISKSGTEQNYITIKNYPGEAPIFTGSKLTFTSSAKYLNFEGFTFKDLVDLNWGECVKFEGGASYINFRNNEITNIKCKSFSASSSNGCNPLGTI